MDPNTPLGTAINLIATSPPDLSHGLKRFFPILDSLSLSQLKQCLDYLRWGRGINMNTDMIAKHTEGLVHLFGGRTGLLCGETFVDVSMILIHGNANVLTACDCRFESMCELYAKSATSLGRAAQAVAPLLAALAKRTQQTGLTSFTPIHVHLLEMCLQSNHFSLAARLAAMGVIDIAPKRDGGIINRHKACLDIQMYFLYCGIAQATMRQFADATHSFAQCIAMPSAQLSAIHVAAAKKYVMCSLIAFGEVKPLPKYTSEIVETSLDRFMTSYHKFTLAYEAQNLTELKNAAQDPVFTHDGNAGLVTHVVTNSFPTTQIARLTSTYLSLSLVEIAKQSSSLDNLAVTELKVLRMIANKTIRATIDQRSNTVRFVDHYDDEDDVHAIQRKMGEITHVAQELQRLEARLVTSRAYVQKLVNKSSSSSSWQPLGGIMNDDTSDVVKF